MSSFNVNFASPWWLLAIIPAVALTVIPFCMIKKERRYQRNRVVSLILRLVAITMVVFLLGGPVFEIKEANSKGEVILLVDHSASTADPSMRKQIDDWVEDIVNKSAGEFRVGIVTFGYGDPNYIGMSYNTTSVLDQYKGVKLSEDASSATDIEAAMFFAYEKFANPETARVIVISDGAETDGKAAYAATMMRTKFKNLRVDTVYVAPPTNSKTDDEVQLASIDIKQDSVKLGDTIDITVTLNNTPRPGAEAKVSLVDTLMNEGTMRPDTPKAVVNTRGEEQTTVRLDNKITTVSWQYTFEVRGLHQLSAKVETASDTIDSNNDYYAYVYISGNSKVLILEGTTTEGLQMSQLINDGKEYTVDTMPIASAPTTAAGLAEYDEIILMNVSNKQFPAGFEAVLDNFVKKFGGGLFTVGGSNSYKSEDMNGTVFEGMLPVEADPRGQPLALLLIIDSSSSMCPPGETPRNGSLGVVGSRLWNAKQGAIAAVNVVEPGDYVSVLSFNSDAYLNLDMTPASRKTEIFAGINAVETRIGTRYNNAIEMANRVMNSVTFTDRKHVIFLTDGEPQDGLDTQWTFNNTIKSMAANGITVSTIGVTADITAKGDDILTNMAANGNGRYWKVLNITELPSIMTQETVAQEVSWSNPGVTKVNIKGRDTSVLQHVTSLPDVGGFYAVKAKGYPGDSEDKIGKVILATAKGNPIYAEWNYGAGHVASFMSPLDGATWGSATYFTDTGARTFLQNVVKSMMAEKPTATAGVKVDFNPDANGNYTTYFRITGLAFNEGDTISARAIGPKSTTDIKVDRLGLDLFQGEFTSKDPGMYKLEITKREGGASMVITEFTTFSYSKEFNAFPDEDYKVQCKAAMANLAELGGGALWDETEEMFSDYTLGLVRSFDPRLALLISAVVLFLLDIAARKFKFKWPHEIVKSVQAKRAAKLANA